MSALPYHPWRLVSGALAGAAFVAITQIITRDHLSGWLVTAVVCFALSIPTMIAFYFYPPSFLRDREKMDGRYAAFHMLYALSLAVTLFGLAMMFFSFGWLPGSLFLFGMLVARWISRAGSAASAQKTGYL